MNTYVEKLVNENQNLIYWGFNKYSENCNCHYREDIFSIANYSLFKTAKAFNPERGIKFSTFYSKVLHNEIGQFYRKQNTKSRNSEYGIDISLSENIKDFENIELESCISNERFNPIMPIIMKETVSELIKILNRDEMKIVMLLYNNPKISQREIGEIVGISQAHVSRRINKIRRKIINIITR